ncbi:alpha/beta fold hydrolase, partial [Gaiella sp.]|uniref:alpha/beta fold hydrolase n=1 Tax=Gaiella sp. TaxID=2663207 RepID=UPI003983291E
MPAPLEAGLFERLGIDPAWSRRVVVTLADGFDCEIHALVSDPPEGVVSPLTVVCVHGNPTWSILWRSFHRRLGDRYRVVAIDHVSMGLSERTDPRRYAQRVDDLGRILYALEVDGPVVLAAHDWGGPIALGWAVEHQESVRGIILGNTGIAMPSTGVPLPIRLARSRMLRDLGCRRTSAFLRGTLVTGHGRIARPIREGYIAPYRSADDRRAIADFVADVPTTPAHPSYTPLAEVAGRLSEIDAPVLLAWGECDPVFHLEFAADLRHRLPQAELHRFPLAGHLVVEEEDVAAVSDAWIERLGSPAVGIPVVADSTPEAPWAALVRREDDEAIA